MLLAYGDGGYGGGGDVGIFPCSSNCTPCVGYGGGKGVDTELSSLGSTNDGVYGGGGDIGIVSSSSSSSPSVGVGTPVMFKDRSFRGYLWLLLERLKI